MAPPTSEHTIVTNDDTLETTSSRMRTAFKHTINHLKLAGQYFELNLGCKVSISLIWAIVINTVLWVNCIRLVFTYGSDNPFLYKLPSATVAYAITHMWFTINVLISTYFAIYLSRGLKQVLDEWDQYHLSSPSTDMKIFHSTQLKATACLWIIVALLSVPSAFNTATNEVIPFANLLPFQKVGKLAMTLRVCFGIYFTWNIFLDVLHLYYIVVLCQCLLHETQVFTSEMQKAVTNTEILDIGQMERFRKRHLALSGLITHLDALVTPCILLSLMVRVPSLASHGHVVISSQYLLDSDDVVHKIQFFGL